MLCELWWVSFPKRQPNKYVARFSVFIIVICFNIMMYQGLGQILIDYCSNFFQLMPQNWPHTLSFNCWGRGSTKIIHTYWKKHDLNSLIPVYINLTLPYKSLNKKIHINTFSHTTLTVVGNKRPFCFNLFYPNLMHILWVTNLGATSTKKGKKESWGGIRANNWLVQNLKFCPIIPPKLLHFLYFNPSFFGGRF